MSRPIDELPAVVVIVVEAAVPVAVVVVTGWVWAPAVPGMRSVFHRLTPIRFGGVRPANVPRRAAATDGAIGTALLS